MQKQNQNKHNKIEAQQNNKNLGISTYASLKSSPS